MFSSTQFLLSSLLLLMLQHTASHSGSGPHIADVNILLPPKMTHPVEYRLQGSDGCFKWSWDHHDILSVFPEYNSSNRCSTSALLKSVAPYSVRKETAVYATDLNTGAVIRCKVYIDKISRIQIFHNIVKLDLDGLATLRVRAFDSEENVFSSLVGLQFVWQLMPEIDGSENHLAHVPLKDSPLSDCGGLCGDLDTQVKLEESGVFSDLYVLKGIEIGHEHVSVHLQEPLFEHLADRILLTVAEAMSLDPPSPVYVLIDAVIPYTLIVIRNTSPRVVNLPSPFHKWTVLNSSVARVEREMGRVHALNLGITAVVVEDTRLVGHLQMSSLHVVLPDNIVLFMSPLSVSRDLIEDAKSISSASKWYAVAGREYLIHIKVFSTGPRAPEIYLTESDDIDLYDDQDEFWNILPVSEGVVAKNNRRILSAKSCGLGKLTATLAYSTGQDVKKEVLKVVQEVMVCDPVKFSMEGTTNVTGRVLLPWVPGVYQELEIRASGGCAMSPSDYKWFSSNMAVVSVSVSGLVQAKKPGKATIRAVSIFDSLNYDEIVIEVSVPTSMAMLPSFPVETSVGSHLQASVALRASNGASFYACDAFRSSIRWKTEGESFMIVNSTAELIGSDTGGLGRYSLPYDPPCAWTNLYALNPGRSVLHATLAKENQQYDLMSGESVVLKASLNVAAYSPLIVHQVSDGNQFGGYWFDLTHAESQNLLRSLDYVYLTPGTQLDVMLHGGPERWGQDVEFFETAEVLDETESQKDRLFVHQLSARYVNSYRIGCENVGTFKLTFRRGNLIGEDHPLPTVAEVHLLLMCTFPSSIVILADETLNSAPAVQSAVRAERMPGGIRASPITVANGRRIRISAVGITQSGKAFANASSLYLTWELSECEGLASFDDVYSSTVKSSWERFLILGNYSGLCIVRSSFSGFVDSMSHLDFIRDFEHPTDSLTDAIQLQLVSSLRVHPEFSLLFFHPAARSNITVTGGSSFLETLSNDTQVVEVIQQVPAYQCTQIILAPKNLGSALVTVHDIGLVPPLAAFSTVQVADVEWIKILTGEYISIEEGSLQLIQFLVGVGDGNSFDPAQYIYMNIHVHIEESVVEVVGDKDFILENHYVCGPNFTLQGTGLGVTAIYLTAVQHNGHEIMSQPVKVEVYAPPRIHPSVIFLVPGASYVLTVRGGPRTGHIEYASMDHQTAKIHKFSGRISAFSPGNSTLVATIYGEDDIMLCQAYGKVKVGIPSSAVLNIQSEQLAIGRRMPIHPSLSEGNLFSFYELCKNFNWSVEDKEVIDFQDVSNLRDTDQSTVKKNQRINPMYEPEYKFIQILHGVSAGKTNVKVSFSCDFRISESSSRSMVYNASISLWVAPNLPLALGSPITWIFPSHYISSDLLPLSSPGSGKGHSLKDKGIIAYSLLGPGMRNAEELQDDAIYIDGPRIITKESGSLACIQAKDKSTGRAEIASCVRVAEMAQIRIMADDFPVYTLAVGAEFDIQVKYHDTLGNPFSEANNITLFEAETNYRDIVSIGSPDVHGNIHLRTKGQGVALVRIAFTSNPQKADYIVISVGPYLHPQNPVLYPGTILNFNIKGLNSSASGQWLSGNESVLSVDRLSGRAEAIQEGTTPIHFVSSSLKLHTAVTVLKGNTISVHAPSQMLTNVPLPANGHAFSVKFSDSSNHHRKTSGNDLPFFFECAVDPANLGFSKPWNDVHTGKSYCLFFPYSPEHLARSIPSSGDAQQQISVTVSASLVGDHRNSGSASALFVGGFAVVGMDENSLHLNLTPNSNIAAISIVGNTDVQINWCHKDRLTVKPISGRAGGNHVQYEVKVHGSEKFVDQIIFSLPSTGQRVEIDVKYEDEEKKTVGRTSNMVLWTSVLGFLFLTVLTVSFFICYLDRPDRLPPPVASSSSPGVAAPVTPQRSSPAVTRDQSPRTPQPFIDYVRRTLDETPYYRQDFRRRVNPQHTF